MARDREQIKRRWEDSEDDQDSTNGTGGINPGIEGSESKDVGKKFDEMMARAEPMVEQLNHLYKSFTLGLDKIPPNVKRRQLDQLMVALLSIQKINATYRFRFETLNAKYLAHRDRWDRMMKDLESGKIKRIVGR